MFLRANAFDLLCRINDRQESMNRTPILMKPKEPSDAPLKPSDQSNQQKVDPIQWILPSLGCCYVPLVFMLSAFTSVDDYLDGYSLFVNSGFLLMFLLPVYIVWIIRQRLKKRNVTNGLTLFQIISVIPLALWLFFVMTFGGSPA